MRCTQNVEGQQGGSGRRRGGGGVSVSPGSRTLSFNEIKQKMQVSALEASLNKLEAVLPALTHMEELLGSSRRERLWYGEGH